MPRMADNGEAEPTARAGRGRRLAVTVLVAAAGIGVGVLATNALTGADDSTSSDRSESSATSAIPTSPEDVEPPVDGAADAGPGAADATSAEAAVTGFLDAEQAGDLATSYTFLSPEDRAEFASPAGWESVHAELLAPVLGYTIETVDATATPAEVIAVVELEPSLDQVVGLVPSRARATWAVDMGPDGQWGVVLAGSTIEALYPSDDGVVPAAQAWAAARADCDEDPPEQFVPLLGVSDPADALCDSSPPAVGEPGPLPEIDAAPFLTAFGRGLGGPATTWARVVDVDGPVPLRAVLAPVGESWIVVGVLPA